MTAKAHHTYTSEDVLTAAHAHSRRQIKFAPSATPSPAKRRFGRLRRVRNEAMARNRGCVRKGVQGWTPYYGDSSHSSTFVPVFPAPPSALFLCHPVAWRYFRFSSVGSEGTLEWSWVEEVTPEKSSFCTFFMNGHRTSSGRQRGGCGVHLRWPAIRDIGRVI